jgi:hypothetical protein
MRNAWTSRRVALACMAAWIGAVALPAAAAGGSFAGAPQSQHFSYGSSCPAAPANRYLSGPAGCLSVRLADVDGDGKADLVLLYTRPGVKQFQYRFTLKVYRASGGTLTAHVPEGDIPATIERLRDVNGRRGVEIFVHEVHVTTAETMGVYAFDGKQLRRAGGFSYGGSDVGIRFGFTCQRGMSATIVQDQFSLVRPPDTWQHMATSYRWDGAALRRGASRVTTFKGSSPPAALLGAHC